MWVATFLLLYLHLRFRTATVKRVLEFGGLLKVCNCLEPQHAFKLLVFRDLRIMSAVLGVRPIGFYSGHRKGLGIRMAIIGVRLSN